MHLFHRGPKLENTCPLSSVTPFSQTEREIVPKYIEGGNALSFVKNDPRKSSQRALCPPLTQILFPCYSSFCSPFGLFLCAILCLPGSFLTVLGFLKRGCASLLDLFRGGTGAALKAQAPFFAPFVAAWGQVGLEAMAKGTVYRAL